MAGPFSPQQQAEIQDTRLAQTTLPQSQAEAGAGIAQAVVQGAGAVVQRNTELAIRESQEEAKSELGAVTEALEILRSGDSRRLQTLEDSALQGNAASRAALEEFRNLRSAQAGGALPSNEAAVRTRAILKNAIADAPEFADELRAAAQQALGFSPEAKAVSQFMREPKAGPKTETQKRAEEIAADIFEVQQTHNVDEETARNIVMQARKLTFDANTSKQNMTIGQYTTQKAATAATDGMNLIAGQYMSRISQLAQANPQGVVSTADAKAQLGLMVESLKSQMLAGVTDSKQRGDLLQEIGRRKQDLEKWTDQIVNMGDRQSEVFNSMVNMAKANAVLTTPEIAVFAGLGDPAGFMDYMDTIAKWGGDTKLMESAGVGAGDRLMVQLANGTPTDQVYRETYLRFLQKQAPMSEGEANLHAVYARNQMKQQDVQSETMMSNFGSVVETKGEFTAVTMLEDGGVIENAMKNPKFASHGANVMAAQLSAANEALNRSIGGFNMTFADDGSITLDQTQRPAPAALGGTGAESAAFVSAQEAVTRYNRVNRINNKWANSGLTTKYEFQSATEQPAVAPASTFTTDITEQANAAGFAPTQDGVYTDASGNRIEVRDGRVFSTGE
jgi:hypothetical protein